MRRIDLSEIFNRILFFNVFVPYKAKKWASKESDRVWDEALRVNNTNILQDE